MKSRSSDHPHAPHAGDLRRLTPSLMVRQWMKSSNPTGLAISRLRGNWVVSLHASGQYWTLCRSRDRLSSSWSDTKPSQSWAIMEPCECPARIIRTTVPHKEAQKALAFLIEPQLPLPLEDCTVIGMPMGRRGDDSEYLASYARKDRVEMLTEGDFVFPGSLSAAALPHLLMMRAPQAAPMAHDGLWLISFPRSWMVVLLVDGTVGGVRSAPRGDLSRLNMACQELHPSGVRRSLGPSNLAGWEGVCGPDWLPDGSEWMALAAIAIRMSTTMTDVRPMTVARKLNQPGTRRWLWGAALLLNVSSLTIWLSTDALLQDRLLEMAVQADQIPAEIARLSKEIRDAASPFSPEPPLPRCFHVLQWLAQVPGLGHDQGLSLDRFRYQMTQYPIAGREREAYQAKVSFEIACQDAFRARKILDAISQPDLKSPVDLKQPLDWSHHQGIYRLSFTLRQPARSS